MRGSADSGLDFRVALSQGLGAFTALQRRAIESRFLYFPDENHGVLKPANAKVTPFARFRAGTGLEPGSSA